MPQKQSGESDRVVCPRCHQDDTKPSKAVAADGSKAAHCNVCDWDFEYQVS